MMDAVPVLSEGGDWGSTQDMEKLLGLGAPTEPTGVGMDNVGQQSTTSDTSNYCIFK
jgi:hypothetical protein